MLFFLCASVPSAWNSLPLLLAWLILTHLSSLSLNTPFQQALVLTNACSSALLRVIFQFSVSFSLDYQLSHDRDPVNLANGDKPAQKHSA